MMRLERFMSWYTKDGESKYINDWEYLHVSDIDNHSYAIEQRHEFLLAFNPLSANMQKMRLQLGLLPVWRRNDFPPRNRWSMPDCMHYLRRVVIFGERHPLTDTEKQATAMLKTCWSREAWRQYYPEGIPPLELDEDDIMKFCVEIEDEDPREDDQLEGFEKIREQTKPIDFSTGERTRMAFEKLFPRDELVPPIKKVRDIKVDVLQSFGF